MPFSYPKTTTENCFQNRRHAEINNKALNEEQALYNELLQKQQAMKDLFKSEVQKGRKFVVENKNLHLELIEQQVTICLVFES